MTELKPCPFCGFQHPTTIESGGRAYVECPLCRAGTSSRETEEEAMAAWNTRAERTCTNVYAGREFECSECGMQWHLLDREDAMEEWAHVRKPSYCPSCGAKVVE